MPPTRKDDVLRYLTTHVGKIVFLSDMAEDLNMDERSVQNVMYKLKGENPQLFKVQVRGRAWCVNGAIPQPEFVVPYPNTVRDAMTEIAATGPAASKLVNNALYGKRQFDPQNPAIFDQVGVAENGDIIAMDSETNKLYRVIPL
jgi:hypothetical protein